MAQCAVCGKRIGSKPVWVEFGDKHQGRIQDPWPLHERCFPKDGKITVAENTGEYDETGAPVIREFETTRYVKVEAPHG